MNQSGERVTNAGGDNRTNQVNVTNAAGRHVSGSLSKAVNSHNRATAFKSFRSYSLFKHETETVGFMVFFMAFLLLPTF